MTINTSSTSERALVGSRSKLVRIFFVVLLFFHCAVTAQAGEKKCKKITSEWTTIDTYMTAKKVNHQIISPYGRKYELANGIWFGQKRVAAKKKKFSEGTVKSLMGFGRLKIRKADNGSSFEICHRIVDRLQDDPR